MRSLAGMRLRCLPPLLLLLSGEAAALEATETTKKSVVATSRRLKGKVFVGAPGTYIGQDEGHHATTTEGVVVGHFDDKNGTVTLDSEATKEIGQEVEFMIEAAEHAAAREHNHEAPEEPTEEEDLLALTIGSFLGSFVPLSIFLYVIYRMVQPRIDVWVKNLDGSTSMADTDSDEGSLCTIDCSGDDQLDDDVNDHDESILSLSYGNINYNESYSSATGDIFQDEEVDVDMLADPCDMLNGIYDQGKNVADGDFLSYAKDYYERRSQEREEEQQKQQQSSEAASNPITFAIRKSTRTSNQMLNSAWLSTSLRGSTTRGTEEDHTESSNQNESNHSESSSRSSSATAQKQSRRASSGGSSASSSQQRKASQPKPSRRSKNEPKTTKKSLLIDWSGNSRRNLGAGDDKGSAISPRSTRPGIGAKRSSIGSFARNASEHSSTSNSPATRSSRMGPPLNDGSSSSGSTRRSPLGSHSRRSHHEDGSRPMSEYSTGTFGGGRTRGYNNDYEEDEGLPLNDLSSPNNQSMSDWSTRRGGDRNSYRGLV